MGPVLNLYKRPKLAQVLTLQLNIISVIIIFQYGCNLSGWAGLGQTSQKSQFYSQTWP